MERVYAAGLTFGTGHVNVNPLRQRQGRSSTSPSTSTSTLTSTSTSTLSLRDSLSLPHLIPIDEHPSPPPHHPIQRARKPYRQPLHPPRQPLGIPRGHPELRHSPPQRSLGHLESRSLAPFLHRRRERGAGALELDVRIELPADLDARARTDLRPARMGNHRLVALRLASRSRPPSAPVGVLLRALGVGHELIRHICSTRAPSTR